MQTENRYRCDNVFSLTLIKKCNVIDMTIRVHTINGVIRTKKFMSLK